MIAAAAVLLLYRFSFSVPGYEGRHFSAFYRHYVIIRSRVLYI